MSLSAQKLLFRKGNKADLPTLDNGEAGWAQDTQELYVGSPLGNVLISGGGGGSSGLQVSGSLASPNLVSAATPIPILSAQRQLVFVAGSGGPVVSTATPQVAAGSILGQELDIFGCDDTNTLTLADGNGLALNGSVVLKLKTIVSLVWDGFVWAEVARR